MTRRREAPAQAERSATSKRRRAKPRSSSWPVLRSYAGERLARIALPVGGIGTGTVSLGGRGDLRDFEIMNRPAKGFTPQHTFFALWTETPDGAPVARALERVLAPPYDGGPWGSTAANHGLPRFREAVFEAAYPLAQVRLSDPDVPLRATLQAFNPFVPADAEASGIPAAVFRFVLTNPTSKPLKASVCASLQNIIGNDGMTDRAAGNRNAWRAGDGVRGLFLTSDGVDPAAEQFGTMALVTTAAGVSVTERWPRLAWGDDLLRFWDDFSHDGRLEAAHEPDVPEPVATLAPGPEVPVGSIAAETTVPAGGEAALTFLLAWHFPNRRAWDPEPPDDAPRPGAAGVGDAVVGNYYATRYADAWEVAERTARELAGLEAATVSFVRDVVETDVPEIVKEAALFNLTPLRSQTTFRTADGRFYGFEGCYEHAGSCFGSASHVWNYEHALPFLFGELARSMREVEFAHAAKDDGHMTLRVPLPIECAAGIDTASEVAAADGQMGTLVKLYREWQLSGDDAFLKALWPRARRALEFCWIPGGWDADRDGVMEGCQHTIDVEYFGPNPLTAFWYLGALRAGEEMARHLGEDDFADTCHELFARGSAWIDEYLFNGEYYEQIVVPPEDPAAIAAGLRWQHSSVDPADPQHQLAAGCVVDQLVGQLAAHVCGLGHLARPEHLRQTLVSILRHNFREQLHDHFNHMRSFALSDDRGLVMCSYPRGPRPAKPFPYFNELMTGFEYAAAIGMLYEGQTEAGLRCIQAVRERHDGHRRNPFDEPECGHHYARTMIAWAGLLACTGFSYSAVDGALAFRAADAEARYFWSTGSAWGTIEQRPVAKGKTRARLRVRHGDLKLRSLTLTGLGSAVLPEARLLGAGETFEATVPRTAGGDRRADSEV